MNDFEAGFGHITDKLSLNYFPFYQDILTGRVNPAILEIGVAYGGSLLLWREMFPESTIVGVDLWGETSRPELPQVTLLTADQRDPGLADKIRVYADSYDLVIDDASHFGSLSDITFTNLWPVVKPGGWYVLEDWPVGLESNPHYPRYEGDSMLKLAQSFIARIEPAVDIRDMGGTGIAAGRPGSVDEVRYRYGLAMIHKKQEP